ncbi:Basic leucine zipper and W2 domain-containing protein 1-A [Larimichthys crocea]|uniref:Uncharacterized protein n=1 Tax=Larimichthys crocea TaxID=215358 RepID=A0ACD3QYI0_LARCR|nr:Basic leucine zipper and W2 domain-containing protein 1-A [Larimichthys crocea]
MKKANLSEQSMISMIWTSLMSCVEWNKKEELVTEQAIKHLKQYSPLLKAFTSQGLSELSLLLKIQEYCYDNIHFMKAFQKIVVLLYKADVLNEEAILKWYNDAHLSKGRSVFLEQMKKFVEWLKNAEEGEKNRRTRRAPPRPEAARSLTCRSRKRRAGNADCSLCLSASEATET